MMFLRGSCRTHFNHLGKNASITKMGNGTMQAFTRLSDLKTSTQKNGKRSPTRFVHYISPRYRTTDSENALQTTQLLVKETIASRKNTSPQNFYETSQLYAAGALKVACVGLQCVGFNDVLYRTICAQSGKWRASADADASPGAAAGLGSGAAWNSSALGDTDGVGNIGDGITKTTGRNASDNENVPVKSSN